MKDAKPVEVKPEVCLNPACHKAYKAPYAKVSGHLGVCSRSCEDVWKKMVEDGKHPKAGV